MLVPGYFASESGVPLSAETVLNLGGFDITNAMLMGVLVAVFLCGLFYVTARKVELKPFSKFGFFVTAATEFVLSTITNNFNGDEKKARRFLPLFVALFFFILLNNLAGLLPGMGGSIYIAAETGLRAALLRPFTTDLNGTLALAFISIGTVQYFAIKERGLFGHIKHYFSLMTPWWNPINFFIGVIEIMGEFIRMLTLALRLFGVIYAGEVLLHVIANLSGNFASIGTFPVILMEIFFSAIQAYIFIMLSSVYLAMGTTPIEHESHDSRSTPDDIPKEIAPATT